MDIRSESSDDAKASARAALAARGIIFDEQHALEYVRKGDVEAVALFLAAGLRPDFTDASGIPAVVLAARQRQRDICKLLLQHGANQETLVDALGVVPTKPIKDRWDRLAAMSGVLTFISTLVVAAVGWHFTNGYNERQQENAAAQAKRDAEIRLQQTRVSEMDTVVKMIPQLTQGEQSKKAALLALSALATPELAVQMAQLFGGVGSVQALESIASQNPAQSKTEAVSALASIASENSGADSAAATAASAALEGIFEGKERALVTLHHKGQFLCNGFVAEWETPLVIVPTYCVSQTGSKDFSVRFWDGKQVAVPTFTLRGPIATVAVPNMTNTVRLPLASSIPSTGTRLLKVAYGQDISREPQDSSRLSVTSGIVEAIEKTSAPETGAKGQREVLRVRFPGTGNSQSGGEGGGPFLDANGAVACIVYLSGRDRNIELCLPGAAVRQVLSASVKS